MHQYKATRKSRNELENFMKVGILDDYLNVALEIADWSQLEDKMELTVFDKPFIDENDAAQQLAGFNIIVGMRERTPFPASLINRLPNLKLLVTTGMRNRSFNLEAAKSNGVTVCGTSGLGQPTAELTWALILGLTCHIPAQDNAMKNGCWQTRINGMLQGKTLGIIGLGRLGAAVARVGNEFGMNVIAWSQNLTDKHAVSNGVERVEKNKLLVESDYISIHLVLSDRTRGLLGTNDISQMKSSAYLINTSRGPIIDTNALIDALTKNRIAGAGLDVYDIEPLPENHQLRMLDNVLLTPHMGYVTKENMAHMYNQVAENILAFLSDLQP